MPIQIESVRKIIHPVTEAIKKLDAPVLWASSIGLMQYVEAGRVIFDSMDNAFKIQLMGQSSVVRDALTEAAKNAREEAMENYIEGVQNLLVSIGKKASFNNPALQRCCNEARVGIKALLRDADRSSRPPLRVRSRRLGGPSGSGA